MIHILYGLMKLKTQKEIKRWNELKKKIMSKNLYHYSKQNKRTKLRINNSILLLKVFPQIMSN